MKHILLILCLIVCQTSLRAQSPRIDSLRQCVEEKGMPAKEYLFKCFETADIVRGSTEDFRNMFGLSDPARVYADKVKFYCPRLLCTAGAGAVSLHSERVVKDYPVEPVETVSTVGAGDNFNAGIVYGLLKYDVRRDDLPGLTEADWDAIVRCGLDFSAEACRNLGNSVSPEFAEKHKK